MGVLWSGGRVAGIFVLLACLIGAAAPASAWAQHFDQNTVRSNPRDLKVLETEHFHIHKHAWRVTREVPFRASRLHGSFPERNTYYG